MTTVQVQSELISQISYEENTQVLSIDFKASNTAYATYEYSNVPLNVFNDFTNAPSKGKYFNANIADVFQYKKM